MGTMLKAAALALLGVAWSCIPDVHAHSGGTDSAGCHHDRRRGGYHCHNGGPAYAPQRVVAPRYWPAPAVRPPAPAPQSPRTLSVYRCVDAGGGRHYLAYPRAGCDEITVVPSATSPPRPSQWRPAQTFYGYTCTRDCSGHEAGWEWAEENGIEDESDCGGNSDSFIEGCIAFVQEN